MKDKLTRGHVILLGPGNTEAAKTALQACCPKGLQVGLDCGALHVIVTSQVFANGRISFERLQKLVNVCGKGRLVVLDLSCCRKSEDLEGDHYVVTNRWQTFTDYKATP
jgi:phosphoribosylformimino-5-aminoimidazole carboxamide ribotide isomerase